MDAKNPNHCMPANADGERAMLTMAYVASARLVWGIFSVSENATIDWIIVFDR